MSRLVFTLSELMSIITHMENPAEVIIPLEYWNKLGLLRTDSVEIVKSHDGDGPYIKLACTKIRYYEREPAVDLRVRIKSEYEVF